ncbi:ABC transporter [Rhodococcus rhodnii LMG 5362]|uniref:ABC transporter n=1 Tax=Rhodococcus rhodnii LMG 5362 TaxID=1273125 RepID=R7WQL5_9NOCA|nr:ATP-binding cassette domain-containing protein [Rhodococcus rhodnii]EOM77617.1 ABC transporter [Rhodococcus rhodnii LMG 5362]
MNILSTLTRPDAGVAEVAGHDVVREPAAVRGAIGLTGQFAAVDDLLTGRENLAMMARLSRVPRRRVPEVVDETLERFALAAAADRRVGTYSGGMRRRLDIAVGILARPRVLFLDEPTTGLDPRSRQGVWEFVRELVDDGVSVLLTTQYLEEADQLADEIAVLDHGRIIASGTASELKRRFGEDVVDVRYADGTVDTFPTDGSPAGLRRVLDGLAPGAETVGVRSPSLDDVFLALTGRAVDAAETRPADGAAA